MCAVHKPFRNDATAATPASLSTGWSARLSPRSLFLLASACVLIVFALYRPSLSFQFILDDHRYTSDPRIQEWGHIWDYFSNYVWAQFTGGPPSFYRPVFLLGMRLNVLVSELSPGGWHLLKHRQTCRGRYVAWGAGVETPPRFTRRSHGSRFVRPPSCANRIRELGYRTRSPDFDWDHRLAPFLPSIH
jgi:hypothetical protein